MANFNDNEVSMLSSSKHGLIYLTANDWALVVDKAKRVQFKEGATLIQKGKSANGVCLLLKGSARVVIPAQPSRILGPGEIKEKLKKDRKRKLRVKKNVIKKIMVKVRKKQETEMKQVFLKEKGKH